MNSPRIILVKSGPLRGQVGRVLHTEGGIIHVRLGDTEVEVAEHDVEEVPQSIPGDELWHVAADRPGDPNGVAVRDENGLLVANVIPADAALAAAAPALLTVVEALLKQIVVEKLVTTGIVETTGAALDAEKLVAWLRRDRVACPECTEDMDPECLACGGVGVLVGGHPVPES